MDASGGFLLSSFPLPEGRFAFRAPIRKNSEKGACYSVQLGQYSHLMDRSGWLESKCGSPENLVAPLSSMLVVWKVGIPPRVASIQVRTYIVHNENYSSRLKAFRDTLPSVDWPYQASPFKFWVHNRLLLKETCFQRPVN